METTAAPPVAKRIIVCDDDPDILLLIKTILTDAGYHVDTASGFREFEQRFDPVNPPNLF